MRKNQSNTGLLLKKKRPGSYMVNEDVLPNHNNAFINGISRLKIEVP